MSTQLIKPNYLVVLPPTQHHSFLRNLPPLFCRPASRGSAHFIKVQQCFFFKNNLKPVDNQPPECFIRLSTAGEHVRVTSPRSKMQISSLYLLYHTKTTSAMMKTQYGRVFNLRQGLLRSTYRQQQFAACS